jgi:ribosome biogenesis GTPase A
MDRIENRNRKDIARKEVLYRVKDVRPISATRDMEISRMSLNESKLSLSLVFPRKASETPKPSPIKRYVW